MKKFLVMILVAAIAILFATKTASAQATFVPPSTNNKTSSLHFGFGNLLYSVDFDTSLLPDVDVAQAVSIIGGNWEHNVTYGFYHFRFGFMGLGDTESTSGSSTSTSTDWKDNQVLAVYFGGGYIFSSEFPLTSLTPMPGPNSQPQGMMGFVGGGFDYNIYGQLESHSSGLTDIDTALYVADLSLVALGGVRIPNIGFVFHVSMSFHFRLGWEMRQTSTTGGVESVINLSDIAELEIPFFGMEAGVAYEVPSMPRLRFGLAVKLVNSMMLIFHGGYVF